MTDDFGKETEQTNISTHILTKRMTDSSDREEYKADISTHILTKRMTEVGSVYLTT